MPDNMLPGVGIFGTGPLAKIVVKMLKDHGFVITAVWSRTLKDAEMFAEEMNIPIATNKADGLLLKPEVGCVVIVCPPHLQSPIAVKAMGIGKHVVATWPAGTSQLEVLKMVKGATYYPSLLSMMCHGLRFLPSLTTMKEHINSGHIGDMFLFEVKVHCGTSFEEYGWECDSLMGGGALSMHGSYIIDILSYLSGKKAKSVNGMTRTYVKDTDAVHGVRQITCDDFCTFQLEMDEGITASCTVNSLCFGDFTLEVIAVGSKGRLTVRNHDLYVCLNDQKEELILHQGPKSTDDGNEDESLPTGRLPFPIGLRKAIEGVANSFRAVEAVHGWKDDLIANRSTFDDALYVQTVIDSIKRSNETKQWVSISILEEEPDPNPHLSAVVRRTALSSYY